MVYFRKTLNLDPLCKMITLKNKTKMLLLLIPIGCKTEVFKGNSLLHSADDETIQSTVREIKRKEL